MNQLDKCLGLVRQSFGVSYRFELYSDNFMGESGWFPLEDLRAAVQSANDSWYMNRSFAADVPIASKDEQCLSDDPSMRAISYQQLLEVKDLVVSMFIDDFESKTMRDINEKIIIPVCRKTKKSYALSTNIDGLKIDAFVSHSWDEPFVAFVNSIEQALHHKPRKPNLWICAFALMQGNFEEIKAQLGPSDTSLDQSPFVKALKSATTYLVVRNCKTDLFDRIWCICEFMYARQFDFIPHYTIVAGPNTFAGTNNSCVDARSTDPDDKAKILKELLNNHSFVEIDEYIKELRSFWVSDSSASEKTAKVEIEKVVQAKKFMKKVKSGLSLA